MKLTVGQKQALTKEILKKFQQARKKITITIDENKKLTDYISSFKKIGEKIKKLQKIEEGYRKEQDQLTAAIKPFIGLSKQNWASENTLTDIIWLKRQLINSKLEIPTTEEIRHKMELLSIGDVKTVDELIKSVMNEFNGSLKEEDSSKGKGQSTTKKTVKKPASKAATKTKSKKS